jgi:hypothetical protein
MFRDDPTNTKFCSDEYRCAFYTAVRSAQRRVRLTIGAVRLSVKTKTPQNRALDTLQIVSE